MSFDLLLLTINLRAKLVFVWFNHCLMPPVKENRWSSAPGALLHPSDRRIFYTYMCIKTLLSSSDELNPEAAYNTLSLVELRSHSALDTCHMWANPMKTSISLTHTFTKLIYSKNHIFILFKRVWSWIMSNQLLEWQTIVKKYLQTWILEQPSSFNLMVGIFSDVLRMITLSTISVVSSHPKKTFFAEMYVTEKWEKWSILEVAEEQGNTNSNGRKILGLTQNDWVWSNRWINEEYITRDMDDGVRKRSSFSCSEW